MRIINKYFEINDGFSKHMIMKKVYDYIQKNNLAPAPEHPHYCIPDFEGAGDAAQMLLSLPEFQSASMIKVNPDRPLQDLRYLVLKSKKKLLVPVARLRCGLFNLLENSANDDDDTLLVKSQKTSLYNLAIPIELDQNISVDLIVIGSVAVSKSGRRIGKGDGLVDLEYAMMRAIKAIDEKTTIVTLVHDYQVFDDFPSDIFEIHDMPVDIIVTPNNVYRVNPILPRPRQIYWKMLDRDIFHSIPIISTLRERQQKEGIDIGLKPKKRKKHSGGKKNSAAKSRKHTKNSFPPDLITSQPMPSNKKEDRGLQDNALFSYRFGDLARILHSNPQHNAETQESTSNSSSDDDCLLENLMRQCGLPVLKNETPSESFPCPSQEVHHQDQREQKMVFEDPGLLADDKEPNNEIQISFGEEQNTFQYGLNASDKNMALTNVQTTLRKDLNSFIEDHSIFKKGHNELCEEDVDLRCFLKTKSHLPFGEAHKMHAKDQKVPSENKISFADDRNALNEEQDIFEKRLNALGKEQTQRHFDKDQNVLGEDLRCFLYTKRHLPKNTFENELNALDEQHSTLNKVQKRLKNNLNSFGEDKKRKSCDKGQNAIGEDSRVLAHDDRAFDEDLRFILNSKRHLANTKNRFMRT